MMKWWFVALGQFCWQIRRFRICNLDVSGLCGQNWSVYFILLLCEISVICIMYYMFTHVFCTPWMIRFRESSLFSCEHVQKGIWGQIIWIPFNAHCKGELLLNLKIQNFNSLYLFVSFNRCCHQSPKRGRLKVHLGP